MAYSLFYTFAAEKYLSRLTPSAVSRILRHIEVLVQDPHRPNNNIVKLVGTSSSYRLRIGNIRVVYYLDEKKRVIYITKITPRGSVYSS